MSGLREERLTLAAPGGPRLTLRRAPGLCFLLCFYVLKEFVYLAAGDSKSRNKQRQCDREGRLLAERALSRTPHHDPPEPGAEPPEASQGLCFKNSWELENLWNFI